MTQPPDKPLRAMRETYRLLSDEIVKETKRQFQTGAIVHWVRRGSLQTGEVDSVLGFQAHHIRLRVLNTRTGRTVDVDINDVQEAA